MAKFFILLAVFILGLSSSHASEVTSDKPDLDFSVKFGMTSGSLHQAASSVPNQETDAADITGYAGSPIVLSWNNDLSSKLTLSVDLSLVADFKNQLLAEKGFYISLAYHLMGGPRKIYEDLGFARVIRENPYNFSLVARIGYTIFEVANKDVSLLIRGATFETMFGIQFRQNIGEKSAIALEYLMDMMSLPANAPAVTCKRTAILLSYRFFL